jgi:hypothetical protein
MLVVHIRAELSQDNAHRKEYYKLLAYNHNNEITINLIIIM